MESLSEFLGAKPAAPAAAGADPLDFSDRYNTPIPAARQPEFEAWRQDRKQKFGRDPVGDRYDYDVNGLFLSGQGSDERGHSSDQFKKPNHPTFSDESIYHGKDGYSGGHWGQDSSYTASPTNLKMRSAPELQKYFAENEPKSKLNLPAAAPPAGAAQSLGDFLADPLNAEHSSAESLPSQAQFDQANQTVIQKLRARLAPAIAATEKAASGFFHTPTQMNPRAKGLNDAAQTMEDRGIVAPAVDAIAARIPEATTPAGKVIQGAGRSAADFAAGLTTPDNLALMAGTEGLGLLPKIGGMLPRAVSAYFGADMLKAAYDTIPEVKAAWEKGDPKEIAAAITKGALSGALGSLAAFHAAGGHETKAAEPGTKGAERGTAPRQKLSDFLAEDQPAAAVGKESLTTETAPIATPTGKPRMPGSTGGVKGSEELPLVTDIIKPGTEKPVLSRAETLKPEVAKTLQERTLRSNPDGTEEVLHKVPLDQISPAKPTEGRPQGNVIYGDTVQKYKNAEWAPPVELRRTGPGAFETWEGHHRIEAARDRGDKSILAWTRDADPAPAKASDNISSESSPAAEPLAPGTKILERIANKEDGTEAVIAETPQGFSVSLRDTDADRATGIARIYPTFERAREYANTVKTPAREAAKPKVPEVPRPQDVENAAVEPESKPVNDKATLASANAADNISAAGEIPLPGSVREMPTKSLKVDPLRFQFKQNVGQGGAGEELRGVQKFDPEKSGILSVWHDPADGETYVVNGHNRHALADRTGAPTMTVRYLEAKDAKEARTKGALINIAEGRGDAVDAAKVFRDSGMNAAGLEREGVSLKGEKARQGLALSKLDPHLFSRVVAGDIPVERASIIGEGLENPDDQRALYDLVEASDKKGKYISNGRLFEMIRMSNAETAKHTETQVNLFGEQEAKRSLISEKADVSDYVRNRLSQEKRLFAAVGKESAAAQLGAEGNEIKAGKNAAVAERTGAAQAIYDKLSVTTGAVNDALNRAAARIAKGESTNAVKESAYSEIRGALLEQARRLTGGNEIPAERPQGDAQGRSSEARAREHDQARSPNPVIKSVEDARTAAEKIKVIRENAIARNEAARREAAARRSKFARNDDAKAARRAAADKASGATVAEPPKGNSAKAWAEYRKAQQSLTGKFYKSYGGGIDEILKVDVENGNRNYTVKNESGEVRMHATPISRAWDTREAARAAGRKPNIDASRIPKFPRPPEHDIVARFEHQEFLEGMSDEYHGKRARILPIELTPEESKTVGAAYVMNANALEYYGRAGGKRDRLPLEVAGAHISPADAAQMSLNMGRMLKRDFKPEGLLNTVPRDLEELHKALADAGKAGKSFVAINGHPMMESHHENALSEEVAHSVQAAIRSDEVDEYGRQGSSTRHHLGRQLYPMLADPLFQKARAALERYDQSPLTTNRDNSLAVEVGVRLMYRDAYKQLNLEPQEARDLGAKYVRALRKEYGSEKPRDIAKRVFEHAPEKRGAQPRAESEGSGSEGRGGPTERARSALSRDEGDARTGDRNRSVHDQQPLDRSQETTEGGLFGDAEEIARANQRDADKLTKQKLEAQLKGPISRAEQAKKLKRDKTNRQGDLFGGPAPEETQGGLFGAEEKEQAGFDFYVPKKEDGSIDAPELLRKFRESTPFKAMADVLRPLGRRVSDEGFGAGQKLMRMIERAGDMGEVHAGQMLVRLHDAKINSLDRGQRAELLDQLEGRAKSSDPRVLEVAKVMRGITDEIGGIAAATGVEVRGVDGRREFKQLDDYFPHVLRHADALRRGPVRRDVIENIVRQGIKPDKTAATKFLDDWIGYLDSGKRADSVLQHLVDSGQAVDKAEALASLQRFRSNIQRHGSLEYARELNVPFYDPDPVRVIPFAAATGAKRLAQIAEFGQDHQRINQEILKIAQLGGNAEFARRSIDKMLGVITEGDTAEARVSRFLRAAETFKLGLSAIPNATQGVLNSMLAADAPTVALGFRDALSKRGRRMAIESGAAIEPVLAEAHRELGGGRMVDNFLKYTGFSQTEQFNRAVAANVGARWANKNLEALIRKPADKRARMRLEEMGVDADAALNRGSLTQGDRLMAAKKFSDITQFRTRPEDLPEFASTPIGKVAFQFKSFAYNQARLLAKETIGELKSGRPGRAIRTMFVVATLFPAAGELVRLLRNGITGREQDFEDELDHYLTALSSAGTLGILQDAVSSAGNKKSLDFLAGPAASDIANVGNILANDDLDPGEKLDAIKKYAVQRFAGPARRLLSDE